MTSSVSAPIDKDRIGFFLGAGASIEFGIPSMKKMTATFAKKIRSKPGKDEQKKVFNIIYNSLAKVYGKDKVDLEAIMSVIVGLKEKERLTDNIGELGSFVLERKGIKNYVNQFKYSADTLDNLEYKFKKYIRNNVIIHKSKKIDLARKIYFDFFKQLCTVTNCNIGEDLNPNKYTAGKWSFFTTNYDNAIEDFWVRYRGYSELYLGFEQIKEKKVMYADRFLHNNTDDARARLE